MAARPRICIFSDCFAWPHVFNVIPYEFVCVLSEIEAATVIAPPPLALSRGRDRLRHKVHWAASRALGIGRPPRAMSAQLESPCDIFVFVGAIMDTLSELKALINVPTPASIAALNGGKYVVRNVCSDRSVVL